MLTFEIVGNESAINEVQSGLSTLVDQKVKRFSHKGAGGEAGLAGLLFSALPSLLTPLVDLLKLALPKDRDLKIVVENGDKKMEIDVRDIKEAAAVLDLLHRRGLLSGGKPEK